MPETVIDFLKKTKNNYPEKIACIDDNGLCTYKELWDDSEKIALFLRSTGNIDKKILYCFESNNGDYSGRCLLLYDRSDAASKKDKKYAGYIAIPHHNRRNWC